MLAGRDIMGVAQTGTGKTASFVLPMMDILHGSRARARMPRSLILEPTRELALQVAENFVLYGKYLKLNHALLIGGESMSEQKDALTKGVDVLIATPRPPARPDRARRPAADRLQNPGHRRSRPHAGHGLHSGRRENRQLPAGQPAKRCSSRRTMAPEIRRLADAFLSNPKTITVSKSATVATTIVAGLALVAEHDKREALRRLIRSEDVQNALIFCNRKSEVDILYKSLTRHGFSVGALHGDMPQPARFATLEKFKAGAIRLLVCSDVAARGIDIGGLSHVFNFDVPHHSEDYVHRIGRTGRAGREGHAYTLASPDDRLAVEAIEKLTAGAIPRIVVPGLDVVEWSEGDSRKRRGRGGSSRAPKRGGSESKPREAKKPDDKPQRERAEQAPRRQPRPEPKPESRPETRPETRAETRPEPWTAMPDTRPDRAPRERRWRDEDLGPSVTGFGDDVPAFMMLPPAAPRVPVRTTRTKRPSQASPMRRPERRPKPGQAPRPTSEPHSATLTIDYMAAGGDGAATPPGGQTIFVPFTLPGETVRATITAPKPRRAGRNPGPQPGPHQPALPAFRHLRRLPLCNIGPTPPTPPGSRMCCAAPSKKPASPPPPSPRCNARLPLPAAAWNSPRAACRTASPSACTPAHTQTIVPIDGCKILHPTLERLLSPLRTLLGSMNGMKRAASVAANLLDNGVDLLIRADAPANAIDRTRLAAFAAAEGISRIAWSVEHNPPENAALLRLPEIAFGATRVNPPAGAFLQASPEGEAAIVAAVLAGLPEKLPPRAPYYRAVRRHRHTKLSARHPRPRASLRRRRRRRRCASPRHRGHTRGRRAPRPDPPSRSSPRNSPAQAPWFWTPPYSGAGPQMATLAAARVPTVIMVSCNPVALLREGAMLRAAGYSLQSATPIDQFLWSAQLEGVCVFRI